MSEKVPTEDRTVFVVLQCYGYEAGSVSAWSVHLTRESADAECAACERREGERVDKGGFTVADGFRVEESTLVP